MANEKLVSSVRYNGVTMGVAEIIVEDTSSLSNYTFRVYNADTDAATDPQNFLQLNRYIFRITDGTPSSQPKDIYLRWNSPDGKLLSDSAAVVGTAINRDVTFTIPAGGVGYIPLNTDFFPSVLGYTGQLSLYHDAARTLLIRSYNITVQPLTGASIKILPERNAIGGMTYPGNVIMGEKFMVMVEGNGTGSLPVQRIMPYSGTIGSQPLNQNQWVESVAQLTMNIYKPPVGNLYLGTQTIQSTAQPVGSPGQVINVRMGEVVGQNTIMLSGPVNAAPWENVYSSTTLNLLHRGGVFADYVYFNGQGQSRSTIRNGFSGPVIISANSTPLITVNAYTPYGTTNDSANYTRAWPGDMAMIAYRPTDVTTLETRRQFGRYQKTISTMFTNQIIHFNAASLVDAVADGEYGAFGVNIRDTDLVVLPKALLRSDYTSIYFGTEREVMVSLGPVLANGQFGSYNGRVSVMFLRSSEILENHLPTTPYPRVIKAGRASISNGVGVIDIPGTSSINLTERRYVVQHVLETLGVFAFDYIRVDKAPKRITINVENTTDAIATHYAIWDLGPEAPFPTS